MPTAKNAAEFYGMFNEPVHKAVEYTMDKILTNYKHLINQIVYGRSPEK